MAVQKMRPLNLDKMLMRFARVPTGSLADAGSPEMKERIAREDLKARGVRLRGDKTAIQELVRYEVENEKRRLHATDENIDLVLGIPANGRPNRHSALRDLLIFSYYQLMKIVLKTSPRAARKETARFFCLTCDTKTSRTRRLSTDQVKWAGQRTFDRFVHLHPHDKEGQLLGDAIARSFQVLVGYAEEVNGRSPDIDAFEAHVAHLKLLCRTLDVAEKLDRLEKADARAARSVTAEGCKRKPH